MILFCLILCLYIFVDKEKIHPEGYLKDCEKELQRTKKLAYDFREKGVKIHGIDKVACDPDGTFSPKQCLPDRY